MWMDERWAADAQNFHRKGGSAIDGRTARYPGYEVGQRKRRGMEQCFGWGKLIDPIRRVMVQGLDGRYTRRCWRPKSLHPTVQASTARHLRAFAPLLTRELRGAGRMVGDLRDSQKWGAIGGRPPYLPVVDGTVVMATPLTSLQQQARPGPPLLIGCTDEEARLYTVPSGEIDQVQAAAVASALQGAALPASAAAVYAQSRPRASPGDMLAAFVSDSTFRMPALRFAENRVAAGAPVWNCHFAWQSPACGGRLGASHVVDVAYAFNTLASQQAASVLGGPGLQALADTLFGHWLRFLKTGNPGWARYDLETRPTLRFDVTSAVVADPLAERRKPWAGQTFD